MMKYSSLPHGTLMTPGPPKRTTTTTGVFSTSSQVTLEKVKFPEFGNNCLDTITADVFDSLTCRYDLIIGRDVLKKMGAHIDFHKEMIRWMDRELPMRDPSEEFSLKCP